MAGATTTVRISQEARETLRELSKQTGQSARVLLERSLHAYRDQLLLDQSNAAYAAIREDPKTTAEMLAERRAWDATLADGLVEEPAPERAR
jgi:predicted DNA-binding protein